jgi:hypothetical protein
MKKITSLFAFLFLMGVGVFAQGVSGGAKAGLSLANQTYKGDGYVTSPNFLPGIHAGGYVTAMFSDHFGLQAEVLYSGEGAKSGDVKYKLGYIAVPVLVRFNVNDLLSFHAGPQFSMLASAKYSSGSSDRDAKDDLKGSDIGAAFGASIDLPNKLNFTFRFIKGLSDINDTGSSVTLKNYNIQMSVGYKLFGK